MRDTDCVAFLQWAMPRLGLRWWGFRRVRRQVCRRLARRLAELGLEDLEGYRRLLEQRPEEWARLDLLCRVTISRFYRDRRLWEQLAEELLPGLCRDLAETGGGPLRAWSAGCASGEEPYTLALVRRFGASRSLRRVEWEIIGSDYDRLLLERAAAARYRSSSLRELPERWREQGFAPVAGGESKLRAASRAAVTFLHQDIRRETPGGRLHLILCRNLAFTYFEEKAQVRLLDRLVTRLAAGGLLAIGGHEHLPELPGGLEPEPAHRCVFRAPG